jgi:hypothetical protein
MGYYSLQVSQLKLEKQLASDEEYSELSYHFSCLLSFFDETQASI